MRSLYLFICLVLLSHNIFAQDTTKTVPPRTICVLASAVVPTSGQFLEGRGDRWMFMTTVVAGAIGYWHVQDTMFNSALNQYERASADLLAETRRSTNLSEDLLAKRDEVERLYDRARERRKSIKGAKMLLAAVWVINIADAYIGYPNLRPLIQPDKQGVRVTLAYDF